MEREEKINKTVSSIKQVTFGRVEEEWLDAFKEGMRVALEAEEIEHSLKTCESCEWDNDCDIKWKIIENARDSVKSKYCSLWEQK